MSTQAIELLKQAIALLEGNAQPQAEPTPIRAMQPNEDETTLEGTLGRFETMQVGADQIPLYKGTIKVRTPEGPERWVKVQAWRKVAVYVANNFGQGQRVQAIGRWETNEWTDADGVLHSNQVFSARLIQAA